MHPPTIKHIIDNIDDNLSNAQRLQQDAESYVLHAKASAHDLLLRALLLTQSAAIQARNALSVANIADPRTSTADPAFTHDLPAPIPTPTPDDDPLADRVSGLAPTPDDAPRPRRGRKSKAEPKPDEGAAPVPMPEPDDLDLPGEPVADTAPAAPAPSLDAAPVAEAVTTPDDLDDIFGSPAPGDEPLA